MLNDALYKCHHGDYNNRYLIVLFCGVLLAAMLFPVLAVRNKLLRVANIERVGDVEYGYREWNTLGISGEWQERVDCWIGRRIFGLPERVCLRMVDDDALHAVFNSTSIVEFSVETVAPHLQLQSYMPLKTMPELAKLIISVEATDCDDEFLEHVRSWPKLEILAILGADVSDDAIARCAEHPSLRWLAVGGPRITDACCKTFAKMPMLRVLQLEPNVAISDDAIRKLVNSKHCSVMAVGKYIVRWDKRLEQVEFTQWGAK